MDDFNFELVENNEYVNNDIKKIRIWRENNAPISLEDITRINDDIEELYGNDEVVVETLIRAETATNRLFTLKGFRSDTISFDEEYYEGRVKDESKFSYATELFINVKITRI